MPRPGTELSQSHSGAWIAQVWISFLASAVATFGGIYYVPADPWVRGFLAMGLLFTIGSSISLAKTLRDVHESQSMTKRIDEARVSRLIAEHDPLKPAL
jgi:hypothetical protein